MFRSLPGSTVFYPSDAVATERAVELAANTKGITFIRVSRPATEVIYDNDEVFEVGSLTTSYINDFSILEIQFLSIGKWQTEKKSVTKPQICVYSKFFSMMSRVVKVENFNVETQTGALCQQVLDGRV